MGNGYLGGTQSLTIALPFIVMGAWPTHLGKDRTKCSFTNCYLLMGFDIPAPDIAYSQPGLIKDGRCCCGEETLPNKNPGGVLCVYNYDYQSGLTSNVGSRWLR